VGKPRLDEQGIPLPQDTGFAVQADFDSTPGNEKGFRFDPVTMHGTGLAIKKEKIFSAVAGIDLVADPGLDQANFVEAAQPKIEDQRLYIGHGLLPAGQLLSERGNHFFTPLTDQGNAQRFVQFLHLTSPDLAICSIAIALHAQQLKAGTAPFVESSHGRFGRRAKPVTSGGESANLWRDSIARPATKIGRFR
jgi:hypothetical protein